MIPVSSTQSQLCIILDAFPSHESQLQAAGVQETHQRSESGSEQEIAGCLRSQTMLSLQHLRGRSQNSQRNYFCIVLKLIIFQHTLRILICVDFCGADDPQEETRTRRCSAATHRGALSVCVSTLAGTAFLVYQRCSYQSTFRFLPLCTLIVKSLQLSEFELEEPKSRLHFS